MIALVLLALGLGVALTAYELSPRTRASVDDYARAIRAAHAAHLAADMHLSNAGVAATTAAQHGQAAAAAQQAAPSAPVSTTAQDLADAHANASQVAADAGVDHAVAATEANQAAAQSTADAAKNAKTEAERATAAQSAAKVLAREKQIAAALAKLGVGECGVRSYARVTPQKRDALLAKLHGEGMTVTGDNPWDIDPHQAEVKLRAVWDPRAQVLKLIVTSSAAWAPCSVIWGRIEPKLREVIGP